MNVDWNEVALQWAAGLLANHQVPPIALQALEEGCESWRVALLAGDKDPHDDVRQYFELALWDLGVQVPRREDALQTIFRRRADDLHRLVDGELPLPPHHIYDSETVERVTAWLQRDWPDGHPLKSVPFRVVAEVYNGEGFYVCALDDGSRRVAVVHIDEYPLPTQLHADMMAYNRHFLPEALWHLKREFDLDVD
jgi:hypothetical protein